MFLGDLKSKIETIGHLDAQIADVINEKNALESSYESRIAELQQVAECGDRSFVIIDSQSTELEQYKTRQERLTRAIETLETGRVEKNKEIASLQENIKHLEQLQMEKEQIERRYEELEQQLEKQLELHKERDNKHSEEMSKLKEAAKEATETALKTTLQLDTMKKEKETWQADLDEAEFKRQTAEQCAEEMCEELERTREVEEQMFEEKEQLKSKYETLKEEKLKLEETVERLGVENAKLGGHQNQQQKLHYLLSIKRENKELHQEVKRLCAEKEKCTCQSIQE